MSEQLEMQLLLLKSVSKALDNLKKISRNNYTPAKVRSRIALLKDTWQQCTKGPAHSSPSLP